jgi:hypothetical protein
VLQTLPCRIAAGSAACRFDRRTECDSAKKPADPLLAFGRARGWFFLDREVLAIQNPDWDGALEEKSISPECVVSLLS